MSTINLHYENRDYTPWAIEKIRNSLSWLCFSTFETPDILNNSEVQNVIGEMLKVYTLLKGALNCIDYSKATDLIVRYRADGIQFIDDLLNNTQYSSLMNNIMRNAVNPTIMRLIWEDNPPNRTAIATIIAKIKEPNAWIKRIGNDLERVHFGEESWERFHSLHEKDVVNFELVFDDPLVKDIYEQYYRNFDEIALI